jgi:hypothetical protein
VKVRFLVELLVIERIFCQDKSGRVTVKGSQCTSTLAFKILSSNGCRIMG